MLSKMYSFLILFTKLWHGKIRLMFKNVQPNFFFLKSFFIIFIMFLGQPETKLFSLDKGETFFGVVDFFCGSQ